MTLTDVERSDRRITGTELQGLITELAAIYGWKFLHLRPAKTEHGWRTPVEGPLGKGFPDLLMVHPGRRRTLAIEVKRQVGDPLTPDQVYVHAVLRAAGWSVFVFRPADLSTGVIQAELAR